MTRPLLAAVALAIIASSPAQPQGTPAPTNVRTSVGIQQRPLTGILGDTPLVFGAAGDAKPGEARGKGERGTDGSGQVVFATSAPVVRSNTAWRLRVTLASPIDPTLIAVVDAKDGHEVELSLKSPSAIVAEGSKGCVRCEVGLTWQFTFAAAQKGKKAARPIPGIVYSAEPRR